MAFLCPLLMDLPLFFSGSLALGRGAVQTYEPVVRVPENNRELGGAVGDGGGWGEREASRGRPLGNIQPTWCFGSIYCCSFLQLTWILPAAAKLSCSYSGFSSPRVEWKFTHGDIRGLVCYNNKITGESLHLLADCLFVEGLVVLGFQGRGAPWGSSLQGLPIALAGGRKRAPVPWVLPSSASLSPPAHSAPASSPLAASYENRVTFSDTGITFHSVTRKDTGMYTCMVSDEGGNTYGEVTVQLIVLGTCRRSSVWVCSRLLP